MAWLDSVLTRAWWFIHQNIYNFTILSMKNAVMSRKCICVTGNSSAKIGSLNCSPFWKRVKHKTTPFCYMVTPIQDGTCWGPRLATISHVHTSVNTHRRSERIPRPLKSAGLMILLSELGFHFRHQGFLFPALDASSEWWDYYNHVFYSLLFILIIK